MPASIDRVGSETIREGKPLINLSESLGGVPGLVARDRQNYAQDLQLSIRGFGARSTFGIRGVRLYRRRHPRDPARRPGPDLQLRARPSTDRIEVLRGPFSALYGNASGGVIQVFSEEGRGAPTLSVGGSLAATTPAASPPRRAAPTAASATSSAPACFKTDGYRDHSAAARQLGNAKLTWQPDDASKLTLVANRLDLPKAQTRSG